MVNLQGKLVAIIQEKNSIHNSRKKLKNQDKKLKVSAKSKTQFAENAVQKKPYLNAYHLQELCDPFCGYNFASKTNATLIISGEFASLKGMAGCQIVSAPY